MTRFVVRRTIWAIPTILLVTFGVFVAIRVGTDPVQSYLRSNPRATQEQIAEYKEVNNLTGTIPEQYVNWGLDFITFDWGESIKGQPAGVSRDQGRARQLARARDHGRRHRHHVRPDPRHHRRPAPVLEVRLG